MYQEVDELFLIYFIEKIKKCVVFYKPQSLILKVSYLPLITIKIFLAIDISGKYNN